MIKIQKPAPPQILVDNKGIWTEALLDAIVLHDGFANIPEMEKKRLLAHYKHKDIQNVLFASTHHKCAFCECKPGESGNIEVEHFEPKSIYPELTFDWENLLPSCRKCNDAKLDFDTRTSPIINPAKEDPATLLTYDFLRIVPLQGSGQENKAQNTIDVCNLNCIRLYNVRSDLMKTITEYMDLLNEKIQLIEEADSKLKRQRRITKLSNSVDIIDDLFKEDKAFSAFGKWLTEQFAEYKKAKDIITNR